MFRLCTFEVFFRFHNVEVLLPIFSRLPTCAGRIWFQIVILRRQKVLLLVQIVYLNIKDRRRNSVGEECFSIYLHCWGSSDFVNVRVFWLCTYEDLQTLRFAGIHISLFYFFCYFWLCEKRPWSSRSWHGALDLMHWLHRGGLRLSRSSLTALIPPCAHGLARLGMALWI